MASSEGSGPQAHGRQAKQLRIWLLNQTVGLQQSANQASTFLITFGVSFPFQEPGLSHEMDDSIVCLSVPHQRAPWPRSGGLAPLTQSFVYYTVFSKKTVGEKNKHWLGLENWKSCALLVGAAAMENSMSTPQLRGRRTIWQGPKEISVCQS